MVRSGSRRRERRLRPHQQRLGGSDRSPQDAGDGRHRKVVDVSQRQRSALHRTECRHHLVDSTGLEVLVAHHGRQRRSRRQMPAPALLPAPVVDELVPGDADQVRDSDLLLPSATSDPIDRRQHGVRSQVFGERTVATSVQQVTEHLRQGPIHADDDVVLRGGSERIDHTHISIIDYRDAIPNMQSDRRAEFSTYAAAVSPPAVLRHLGNVRLGPSASVPAGASPPARVTCRRSVIARGRLPAGRQRARSAVIATVAPPPSATPNPLRSTATRDSVTCTPRRSRIRQGSGRRQCERSTNTKPDGLTPTSPAKNVVSRKVAKCGGSLPMTLPMNRSRTRRHWPIRADTRGHAVYYRPC